MFYKRLLYPGSRLLFFAKHCAYINPDNLCSASSRELLGGGSLCWPKMMSTVIMKQNASSVGKTMHSKLEESSAAGPLP